MFLYLKTGGGHLAPAKAVANRIKSKHKKGIEIELTDGLSDAVAIVRNVIEGGYKTAINKAAWTYEFLYLIHKIRIVSKLTSFIVSYFVKPGLEKHILLQRPDKIVLFHFFLIKPVYSIIKENNLTIPVITVVTDPFTAHPIWFLQENQNYIVFSDMLKDKCIQNGIDEKRLKVFPFVLDSKFSRKLSMNRQNMIRSDLGFKTNSRIILILGGGEGIPKGRKILKKMIRTNIDAEIAIVCGKNEKLYKKAMKIKEQTGSNNLKVYAFIDFVHSLISISDIVVTKCGASTSMEILMMGKIPVINSYIWEQEKGNMEFICNRNMGIMEKNTGYLPQVLGRLLKEGDLYNSLRNNIRKESIRNGVGQVSEYILNFQ